MLSLNKEYERLRHSLQIILNKALHNNLNKLYKELLYKISLHVQKYHGTLRCNKSMQIELQLLGKNQKTFLQ